MKTIEDIDNFKNDGLVLTVGFFDGVHVGHQHLINCLRKVADEEGLQSAVLTFWPHPRIVLDEDYKPSLLNSMDEKFIHLSALPIDYCIKMPFSTELSNYFASDFMKKILKEKLNVKHLVVGYDHRFGRNREEGIEDYRAHGKEIGMKVSQATPFYMDGFCISSSFIRSLLKSGEAKLASKYLGYPYQLKGTVIKGSQVGRKLGFPTANVELDINNKCLPKVGVYAVKVSLNEALHNGMLYIGSKPTFGGEKKISIEVNLFDFNEDIYGETICIELIDFVRKQERFENEEILKQNIASDKEKSLNILKSL